MNQTLNEILKYDTDILYDSDISKSWIGHIKHIQDEFKTNPPAEFLKFPTVKLTMFLDNCVMVNKEYDFVFANGLNKWKDGLQENDFGSPSKFIKDETTSGNTIHQTYHLANYENTTGKNVLDFDYILDFGGGYGCMGKTLKNLGYKGKYIIYDIKFMSLIQKYYLESIGLKENDNFYLVSNLNDLPTFNENSLFIATWSLNEVPVKLREEVKNIVKDFNGILIAYNRTFDGVDNVSYFSKWHLELMKKYVVYGFEMPFENHSNYLLV